MLAKLFQSALRESSKALEVTTKCKAAHKDRQPVIACRLGEECRRTLLVLINCSLVQSLGIAWIACVTGILSHFCTRSKAGQPQVNGINQQSADDCSDVGSDGSVKFEAFGNDGVHLDGDTAHTQTPREEVHGGNICADDSKDDYSKPRSRKDRIKAALAKLKRGPDGRYTNVFEVATDVDMLIAAYQNLRAKANPSYIIDDSDEEDETLEGIDIERFKKLQKRLRSGTYKFQPVVHVPLPKPKIEKTKKKKPG